MIKFETNKTYTCKSICDSNSIFNWTISRRTDKSVWIGTKRFAVHTNDDSEFIYPEGQYSMCPVLRATKVTDEAIEQTEQQQEIEIEIQVKNNITNLADYRKVI